MSEESQKTNQIVIDIAEKPYVFNMFDKLKISYIKEEIIVPDPCGKHPLRHNTDGRLFCVEDRSIDIILNTTHFSKDDLACGECEKATVRVGDFTNEARSFLAERKRVDDYYASMADGRLYEQARKMYQYCDGLKIIILEGMADMEYFEDSINPFNNYDKDLEKLKTKSPLQQLIEMHPDKKDWIFGTIKDLASCGVALIQTWNLEETAFLINQISQGAGEEPKIRAIPHKISGLTLEETMLTVIPRIGKVRAQNLVAEYGSLPKLITAIRDMSLEDANKRSITKILKQIFG